MTSIHPTKQSLVIVDNLACNITPKDASPLSGDNITLLSNSLNKFSN